MDNLGGKKVFLGQILISSSKYALGHHDDRVVPIKMALWHFLQPSAPLEAAKVNCSELSQSCSRERHYSRDSLD